jgi:hypothetical protein
MSLRLPEGKFPKLQVKELSSYQLESFSVELHDWHGSTPLLPFGSST